MSSASLKVTCSALSYVPKPSSVFSKVLRITPCTIDSLHCAGSLTRPVVGSSTRLLGKGRTAADGSNWTVGPALPSPVSVLISGQPTRPTRPSASTAARVLFMRFLLNLNEYRHDARGERH